MKTTELIKSKIFLNYSDIEQQLSIWRFMNKKIVFTNGCFDILHLGHVDYLVKASEEGDVLIVGVNSDSSVKELKGTHRPINDQSSRLQILACFSFINVVILFDELTPYELIKFIQPDVLVKGSDYQLEQIVGYDIVQSKGGKIKRIDFLPGYSTSLIEKTISENSKNQLHNKT